MKESHRKGVSEPSWPRVMRGEPQGCRRSVDRGTCRLGIELRNNRDRSADVVPHGGRQHRRMRYRQHPQDSAQSETPGMYGNSTRKNRQWSLLKSHPEMKVYVDTYCDATGGKRLKLRLSQQRAAIVSAYLEDHGIASDRLIARGFGATHFIPSRLRKKGFWPP